MLGRAKPILIAMTSELVYLAVQGQPLIMYRGIVNAEELYGSRRRLKSAPRGQLEYLNMRRRTAAILLLLTGAGFAQTNQPRVVSSGRGWYQGKTLLLRDGRLEPSTRLTSTSGTSDLILDCGNRGWFIYQCGAASCSIPPCAEAAAGGVRVSRAYFAHISEMLNPLVRREQADLAVSGVRGPGGPADAVVMLTPQGVHWAPALIRVLEGSYCFRLTHLPPGPASNFTLNWDRTVEKEGIAALANLQPGLYALAKGMPGANGACSADPNGTTAWVLVVPQASFAGVNQQWEQASSQVDDLEQAGASTSAVGALRHAILAWLADSVEGK
jgi:hypothetical protein